MKFFSKIIESSGRLRSNIRSENIVVPEKTKKYLVISVIATIVLSLLYFPYHSAHASAVVFRAASSGNNAAGALSLAVTPPAGNAAGDVLIVSIDMVYTTCGSGPVQSQGVNGIVTTPAMSNNFIARTTDATPVIAKETYYIALTANITAMTINLTCSGKASAGILDFSGVDTAAPIETSSTVINASSTTLTANAVTANQAGDMAVALFGVRVGTTISAPTNAATLQYQDASTGGSAATRETSGGVTKPITVAGSTGAFSVTAAAAGVNVAHTLILKGPLSTFTQASYRLYGNQDSTGPVTFVKTWGGAAADQSRKIITTSDGGYAITGYTASSGAGGIDLVLNKYDSAGNIVFSKTWGGTGDDIGLSLVQTSDGGYAVTGYTTSNGGGIVNAGFQDMILLKFDSSGALTWQTVWGGVNYDQGISVVQTADGGYAVTGQSNSYGANGYEFIIVKYTSAGAVSFSKTWGGTGSDVGEAIIQTADGGYAIAGYTNSSISAGGYDSVILKLDSAGVVTNQKTWGGTLDDYGFSIIQTSDGGYAVAGGEASFGGQGSDAFVVKYDSTFTVQFAKNWGGAGSDYVYQVVEAPDTSLVFSGRAFNLNGSSGDDMSLSKFTNTGTLNLFNVFGGAGAEVGGNSIATTPDGGYAIAGETTSTGAGLEDIALVKYDSTGNIYGCGSLCASPAITAASITATISTPAIASASVTPTTSTPTIALALPVATITSYVQNGQPIDVGSPLAALNTAASTPADGQPFRLRLNINIGTTDLPAAGQSFKLQYAPLSGGGCSATPTGNYSDVTNSSTVGFYNNANAYNSIALTTNANDPTDGSNTLVRQSYQEFGTSTFSNPTTITNGSDGMWDFGLTTSGTTAGTHYCLRVTSSTGSLFNSYTNFPEIIAFTNTPPVSPTLLTPLSGAINVSNSPTFTLTTTDPDGDVVKYKLNIYQSDCTTLVASTDMTSSTTGWDSASYSSGSTATYSYPGVLSDTTVYCWTAAAIDALGSNTWSAYSATQNFTTAVAGVSSPVILKGGTVINGGTRFGN